MKATSARPSFALASLAASALLVLFGCGSGPGSGGSTTGPQSTTRFLLVADSYDQRVLIFDAPFSTNQSASVVLGQADFTSHVHEVTANGLRFPEKAIADADGNVWVSDTVNNRVLQYAKPFTNGMAASLVLGHPDFTTSGPSISPDSLHDPYGMGFDKDGNLWVVDGTNNRVVEFAPPFGNGMAATLVLGQTSLVTRDTATSISGLNNPVELAFDASGDLWLVDRGNNRVLEYKPPFVSGQPASVVLGQQHFTSSLSATTSTGLAGPAGIAIDGSGSVWVSDYRNDRILRFAAPIFSGQAADLVLGQPNFTTNAASGDGQIDVPSPEGLAFDTSGNLFVAEESNRVVIFAPPFRTYMKATIVIGQSDFNSSQSNGTAMSLGLPESVSTF